MMDSEQVIFESFRSVDDSVISHIKKRIHSERFTLTRYEMKTAHISQLHTVTPSICHLVTGITFKNSVTIALMPNK
jgi:hypothetical protein